MILNTTFGENNRLELKGGEKVGRKSMELVLLLIMLALFFVPSATANVASSYADLITPYKAELYATFELNYFSLAGLTGWGEASVGDIIPLFNGEKEVMFYKVLIVGNQSVLGMFLINARKSMGVPIADVNLKPREIDSAYSWVKFAKLSLTSEETAKGREMWASYDMIVTQPNWELTEASWVEKQLDVPIYIQETEYYCSPASAQMVLDYHGYYYSQDQIAEAMDTTEQGTNPEDIPKGIIEVTDGQVYAENHYAYWWDWLLRYRFYYYGWILEIDADNPPLGSHIVAGHTVAGRGYVYSTDWWAWWEKYYIYNDPWDGEVHMKNIYLSFSVALTWVHPLT